MQATVMPGSNRESVKRSGMIEAPQRGADKKVEQSPQLTIRTYISKRNQVYDTAVFATRASERNTLKTGLLGAENSHVHKYRTYDREKIPAELQTCLRTHRF